MDVSLTRQLSYQCEAQSQLSFEREGHSQLTL